MVRSFKPVLVAVSLAIVFSFAASYAWTAPGQTAPNGNVSAPINTSATAQTKTGSFIIGSATSGVISKNNGDFYAQTLNSTSSASVGGGLAVNGVSLLNTTVIWPGTGTGGYLNFDYTAGGTSGSGSTGYGIQDSAGTLKFKNNGGSWADLNTIINNYLTLNGYSTSTVSSQWATNGTKLYYNDGNVGIGTSSPSVAFEVGDSSTGGIRALVTNSNTGTAAYTEMGVRNDYTSTGVLRLLTFGPNYTSGTARYIADSALIDTQAGLTGGLGISTVAAAPIRFYTTAIERMRIDDTGRVGIGTSTPQSPFVIYAAPNYGQADIVASTVNGESGLLFKSADDGDAQGWLVGKNLSLTNDSFSIYRGGSNWFTINTSGKVGVGTTTPSAQLTVGGTPGVDGIMFPDGTLQTSAAAPYDIWSSGTGADIYYGQVWNSITVPRVGIGYNPPTNVLTVLDDKSVFSQSNANTYAFSVGNAALKDITMGSDSAFSYIQSWSNKPLQINGYGNNHVYINGNGTGYVGIGVGATSTSDAKLYVTRDSTNTASNARITHFTGSQTVANSSSFYGAIIDPDFTASGNNTLAALYGAYVNPRNASTGTTTTIYSVRSSPVNASTGLVTNMYGLYSDPQNTGGGTATNIYGLYTYPYTTNGAATGITGVYATPRNNSPSDTVPSIFGLRAEPYNTSTGTTTAMYGLRTGGGNSNANGSIGTYYAAYLSTPTATGPITTQWGVYQTSGTANNYFAGDVGIGTNAPAYPLDVNGAVQATAYYYSSDARLKKIIGPITDAVAKVRALSGISFTWKFGEHKGKEDVGILAQEVQKVLPEAVTTNENTGMMAVDYPRLVPLLIEAIKEQQTQIDSQQQLIDNLTTKVEKLQNGSLDIK